MDMVPLAKAASKTGGHQPQETTQEEEKATVVLSAKAFASCGNWPKPAILPPDDGGGIWID